MIIYKVENKINGKIYIGKTIQSLDARRWSHIKDSRRGCEFYFHRAIRKYGIENFEWMILSETDNESKLNAMEKFYIMIYRKISLLYNQTDGGEGCSGRITSETTKQKQSAYHKNRPKEHQEKILNYHRNRPIKHGENISKSKKGHLVPVEIREKISLSQIGKRTGKYNPFYGKHHTEETKKKLSESHKGKTSWMKDKHHTEEAKKKISDSKKGKTSNRKGVRLSEETKLKMSLSHKKKKEKKDATFAPILPV